MAAPEVDGMQTAVVTGGGNGLGADISHALHEAGFRVVVSDVDMTAAEDVAIRLDSTGQTAVAAKIDVSQPGDFQSALDMIVERWDKAHVLVNNAARTEVKPLLDIDPADFNNILATNAGGCFAGSQIFGRHFKQNGYGRIINLASIAGQNGGTATGAHYAASKGAILTLTKVFARDLAAFGVTTNAIAPGPHDTPMVRSVLTDDKLPAALAGIPVGHLGDPKFVAKLIVLMAGPEAGFVNGACFDVNGGIYMR
ncbi:SDR family oxidoreductase [Martelella mediterranea]|nr:SDR family oxidoreductase [Martelella mediterranea]